MKNLPKIVLLIENPAKFIWQEIKDYDNNEQVKNNINISDELDALKNENEYIFNYVGQNWDNFTLNEKLAIMSNEGQKGVIDYSLVPENYNSSLLVVKSNLYSYQKTKVSKILNNGGIMEKIVRGWGKVNKENIYDTLGILSHSSADYNKIIEEKIHTILEKIPNLKANYTEDEIIKMFKKWYEQDYLVNGKKYLEGKTECDFISIKKLKHNGNTYENGYVAGNAVFIKNSGEILTSSHIINGLNNINAFKESDFYRISNNNKISSKLLAQNISEISDNKLNGKEVVVNGIDFSHNKMIFEHVKISGRAFRITKDLKKYFFPKDVSDKKKKIFELLTKDGCFMMLLENNQIIDYNKLKGVSGAPVYFYNEKTKQSEVVGIFMGKMEVEINGKKQLAIFFNGPSILAKK